MLDRATLKQSSPNYPTASPESSGDLRHVEVELRGVVPQVLGF
jgi:hypothetical protein